MKNSQTVRVPCLTFSQSIDCSSVSDSDFVVSPIICDDVHNVLFTCHGSMNSTTSPNSLAMFTSAVTPTEQSHPA